LSKIIFLEEGIHLPSFQQASNDPTRRVILNRAVIRARLPNVTAQQGAPPERLQARSDARAGLLPGAELLPSRALAPGRWGLKPPHAVALNRARAPLPPRASLKWPCVAGAL